MRNTLRRALVVSGILVAAAFAPAAHAQVRGRAYLGPPVVYYYPNRAAAVVLVPVPQNINVATSVSVPDGGEATLGGYSRLSEGRTEYGAPGLGKLPYAGRAVRNTGYGRRAVYTRGSVRVRVIDLREEEYRQTGFRSP
jgi:hypothetical protein